MQNAKTCIFSYNNDLPMEVFQTFTVVQNTFFFSWEIQLGCQKNGVKVTQTNNSLYFQSKGSF